MRHCVSLLSARVIPGHQLADHSVDRRMILLCFMAPVIGTGGAFGAWLLLKSIAIATNAFWFGRLSAQEGEITDRSEERRVGKEGVSTVRARGSPVHLKNKQRTDS